jgi:transcriptional regulator with XRE-family HTH domain
MIVKPFRTPCAVLYGRESVHDVYMGKRAKTTRGTAPGRLRPLYQRTYIKAWREFREMSQEELAGHVAQYLEENEISEKGYTYASIGRMENGRIPYSQPIMEGIAKALGVTVAMLISTPPPNKGEPIPPDPETLLRLWSEGARAGRRR